MSYKQWQNVVQYEAEWQVSFHFSNRQVLDWSALSLYKNRSSVNILLNNISISNKEYTVSVVLHIEYSILE